MPAWYGEGYYERNQTYTESERRGRAVMAFKRELSYNGYGAGLYLDLPEFGQTMENQTKKFQAANGLEVDGVIGPKTAKALFKKRANDIGVKYGLPQNLLRQKTQGESAWDPAAYNENKRPDGSVISTDNGLNQINDKAQPQVTWVEAYTPKFSLDFGARYLKSNYDSVKDWDGALAGYNIGLFYAKKWVASGKPTSGLLTVNGFDYAAAATRYVNYVRSQSV